MNIIWDSSRVIRGIDVSTDFSVSTNYSYTQTGGTSGSKTDKDVAVNYATGATTSTSFSVSVFNPLGTTPTITNLSPAVASLSDSTFSPIVTGAVDYTVTVPGNGTRKFSDYVVKSGSGVSTYVITGYTAGSFARHSHDYIAALLAAHPAAPTLAEFRRHSGEFGGSVNSPSGSRNASCWAGNLELAAVSFSRHVLSNGTQQDRWNLPVTLIHTGSDTTTRFGLVAHHTPIVAGYKANFLLSNGSFVQGTVQSVTNVSGDLDLVYFTAPIVGPEPLKTLPSGWETKLPCVALNGLSGYGGQVPTIFVGGRMSDGSGGSNIRIGRWYKGTSMSTSFDSAQTWLSGLFNNYRWGIDVGDSSGVHLMANGGKFVLLGLQHGYSDVSNVPDNRDAISAAMTAIAGTATTFTATNLSAFTTF